MFLHCETESFTHKDEEICMNHWIGKKNFLLERERGKRRVSVFFTKDQINHWHNILISLEVTVPCQHDLGVFGEHRLRREICDGPLDNATSTVQSCRVSAKAVSANTVLGCSLLFPVGCQNGTNHQVGFSLRKEAKEIIAKCSTVDIIINYSHITYKYKHIISMLLLFFKF